MAGSNAPAAFLVYIKTILYFAGLASSSTFSGISLEIVSLFLVKLHRVSHRIYTSRFLLKITFAELI